MSQNQASKVYVPKSSVKTQDTPFGEILKVSFKVEDAVKFFQENVNPAGYINLDIFPRKEAGTYGETHSIALNTYKKPEAGASKAAPAKAKPKAAQVAETSEDDSIPF